MKYAPPTAAAKVVTPKATSAIQSQPRRGRASGGRMRVMGMGGLAGTIEIGGLGGV